MAPKASKVRFVLDAKCPYCEVWVAQYMVENDQLYVGQNTCENCAGQFTIDPDEVSEARKEV
jgi:hypothetical protein